MELIQNSESQENLSKLRDLKGKYFWYRVVFEVVIRIIARILFQGRAPHKYLHFHKLRLNIRADELN